MSSVLKSLQNLLPSAQRSPIVDAIETELARKLPKTATTPEALAEWRNHLDEQIEDGQLRGTAELGEVRAQRDACDRLMPALRVLERLKTSKQQRSQDRERLEREAEEASKEIKRAETALAAAQKDLAAPAQRLRSIDEALQRHHERAAADMAAARLALDAALTATTDEKADEKAAADLQALERLQSSELAQLHMRRTAAEGLHAAAETALKAAADRMAAARAAEARTAVQRAQLEADAAAAEFIGGLLGVVRQCEAAKAAGAVREAELLRYLASVRVCVFDGRRVAFGPEPGDAAMPVVLQPFDQLVQLARLLDGPALDLQALPDDLAVPLLPVAA